MNPRVKVILQSKITTNEEKEGAKQGEVQPYLDGSAENGHIVSCQNSFLHQFHTAIECRLSTEIEENSIRSFGFDNLQL